MPVGNSNLLPILFLTRIDTVRLQSLAHLCTVREPPLMRSLEPNASLLARRVVDRSLRGGKGFISHTPAARGALRANAAIRAKILIKEDFSEVRVGSL